MFEVEWEVFFRHLPALLRSDQQRQVRQLLETQRVAYLHSVPPDDEAWLVSAAAEPVDPFSMMTIAIRARR